HLGGELAFYAVALVVEPPGGAKLHLAGNAITLKATHQAGEHFVIPWIEVIKYRTWQSVHAIERIEQGRQRLTVIHAADRIEAAVRSDIDEALLAEIAMRPQVKLHHPAALRVLATQPEQHGG